MFDILPRGCCRRQDVSVPVISEPSGQTPHAAFFRGACHQNSRVPLLIITYFSRQLMSS